MRYWKSALIVGSSALALIIAYAIWNAKLSQTSTRSGPFAHYYDSIDQAAKFGDKNAQLDIARRNGIPETVYMSSPSQPGPLEVSAAGVDRVMILVEKLDRLLTQRVQVAGGNSIPAMKETDRLVEQISSYKDPRALNVLLRALREQGGASDGLVGLGKISIGPLIAMAHVASARQPTQVYFTLERFVDGDHLAATSADLEVKNQLIKFSTGCMDDGNDWIKMSCRKILFALDPDFASPPPAFSSVSAAGADGSSLSHTESATEYQLLFTCSEKVLRVNPYRNNAVALADDLIYLLNDSKRELYIFTPYFADKTDLKLDKNGKSIGIAGGMAGYYAFHVRIPYLSSSPTNRSKSRGYYYLDIGGGDIGLGMGLPARFLPWKAEVTPDFRNTKQPILEATGMENSGVEFHPLEFEDKIWDHSRQADPSPEAMSILVKAAASRIPTMPQPYRAGTQMNRGHLGQWTMSPEMADLNNGMIQDAMNTCKAAADKFHFALFPSTVNAQSIPYRPVESSQ